MFKKVMATIRANILVGFFLIVPVVATILIFNFVFKLTTNWLPEAAFPELRTILHGYPLRVLTLVAIVIFFYLVGLLTRNILGKRLYQLGEKILLRIPFVKGIYVPVRQISESLFTQRKTLFKEVVLIEYPRKGLYSLAFVTAAAPPVVARHMVGSQTQDEPCVSLFISTTPNPTSGVFILVPKSETIPLDMPVSDALTFIMSAGAVAPGAPGDTTPTLLDKLESWLRHRDTSSEPSNAATSNP
jgi:uncharacterized membrane protein